MILKFKSMKVIELLRYFKKLSDIDKLRLSIHLLESPYLHIAVDKDKLVDILEKQLTALDSSYITTIVNFSKYKHLTTLSVKFMELSEKE